MTINLAKYFENLIRKELKISHFNAAVMSCSAKRVPAAASAAIRQKHGDTFLLDANYLIFFKSSTGFQAEDSKKLFELVNRALGKDANSMTKGDFKTFTLGGSSLNEDELPAEDATADAAAEPEGVAPEEQAAPVEDGKEYIFLKVTVK